MTPAQSSSDWFHVVELEPGVALVGEPGYVFSWLVSGCDDHLLVDSGMGVADIRAAVSHIAEDPLLVNSHAHFDHVGGNTLFVRRAIHPLGQERLVEMRQPGAPWEYRLLDLGSDETRAFADAVHASWRELLALDRTFHFMLGPEEQVRPWPSFTPGTFAEAPPPATELVDEGFVFDLGSRSLRVIHTPGHAAEHICLLDERAGILFAQDQAYYGPHYLCLKGSDLSAWTRSARRLADELTSMIRIIYTAHSLRCSAPPRLLSELAEAGERVLAGEVPLASAELPGGASGLSADFGHFSLVLPSR